MKIRSTFSIAHLRIAQLGIYSLGDLLTREFAVAHMGIAHLGTSNNFAYLSYCMALIDTGKFEAEVTPSTSTQLPPELNKLLEGLKQNGLMPQPITAGPRGLPNIFSNLLPGGSTMPAIRSVGGPMIPSNLSPQEQQQMLMQQMMTAQCQNTRSPPSWNQQLPFPQNRFHGQSLPPPNARYVNPMQRPAVGRPSL
uniref:Uncharacterized protein n=1 Tax=Romanomermis culicivorax TaxID=13658 RepID=A0A915KBM0_ROMCU